MLGWKTAIAEAWKFSDEIGFRGSFISDEQTEKHEEQWSCEEEDQFGHDLDCVVAIGTVS